MMFRSWRQVVRLCHGGAATSSSGAKLVITDNCVKRLREIASPRELLRVMVDSGGCSGFEYKFQLVTDVDPTDDVVFERDGRGVVVDKVSLQFLDGATIDFHEELIRSAFRVIKNPNAEQGCSCGASFAVKEPPSDQQSSQ